MSRFTIHDLAATIDARAASGGEASYTRKLLDKGPEKARPAIFQQLRHWQKDDDLAGVRDKVPLARLPAAEREAWQQLWADVGKVLPK